MNNYSEIVRAMNNHDKIIEKYIGISTEDRFSQNTLKISKNIPLSFNDRTSIKFTYVESEQSDSMFITIEKRYNSQTRYFENPNNLKNSRVVFLSDGRPVKCQTSLTHEFRIDTDLQNSDSIKKILAISQMTPFIEIATNPIFIEDFFKIALGETIEIQISGENGIITEYKLLDFHLRLIKGYYNALFDESYMTNELLESIDNTANPSNDEATEIDEKKRRLMAIEAKMNQGIYKNESTVKEIIDKSDEIEDYIRKNFNKQLPNIHEITKVISNKFNLEHSIAIAKVEEILIEKSFLTKDELTQYNKRATLLGVLIIIIAISSAIFMIYFNYIKK
jgi:hypothetical protein